MISSEGQHIIEVHLPRNIPQRCLSLQFAPVLSVHCRSAQTWSAEIPACLCATRDIFSCPLQSPRFTATSQQGSSLDADNSHSYYLGIILCIVCPGYTTFVRTIYNRMARVVWTVVGAFCYKDRLQSTCGLRLRWSPRSLSPLVQLRCPSRLQAQRKASVVSRSERS